MLPNEPTRSELPGDEEARLDRALRGLSDHTASMRVPEDLEARLIARAEAAGLLDPEQRSYAAVAKPARETPAAWRSWALSPGWAVAGVLAAVVLAVIWRGSLNEPGLGIATETPVAAELSASREVTPTEVARRKLPASHPTQPEAGAAEEQVANASRRMPAVSPNTIAATSPAPSPMAMARPAVARSEVSEAGPETARDHALRFTTQFIPVNYAAPLRADEFVQAVRVRIGAGDLWRLGVPVAAQRQDSQVTADFLLGEDGRPRAVRLVSSFTQPADGSE